MSKIYCDNCEKDDQSITVTALLGLVNQGQTSDTFGSALNPGELPTLYKASTYTPADRNIARQQLLAQRFIRGEGFLPQGKIHPDHEPQKKAKKFLRNFYFLVSLPISFFITLPIGFSILMGIEQPTRNYIGIVLMGLFAFLICLGASKWYKNFEAKCDKQTEAWWSSLSQDEKQLWRKLQDGSYCRRCDVFSPAH
jgi:hypothetical protein